MFDNYKLEIIRINLSTPFLVKTICKECGSHPSLYYCIRNRNLWLDPKKFLKEFNNIKKYYKRICGNHYLMLSPKYFNDLGNFSHKVSYKGFSPKLHYSRGRSNETNISEFLMCECGATSWAYANKAAINCPEILNRKSRDKYPRKFEF